MRLNRNSLLFIALLAIVIIVAMIFLQDNDSNDGLDIEATAVTIQIFPEVSSANVISVSITEIREEGDIRPTPIPGNPTLEPPTPLPEGVEPATTTEIVVLNRDMVTSTWTAAAETTQTLSGTVDSERITSALSTLAGLRSNRQFMPPDGNYAPYGLDEPAFDITFVVEPVAQTGVASEGTATIPEIVNYRLRVGERTVGENSYYAFLNDDSQTIYVINGASTLQANILNLTTTVPVQAIPTATSVPVLNAQVPFAAFVVSNATGFTFTDNQSGDVIEISRPEGSFVWVFTVNGEEMPVQQESLQIILNSFTTISGVSQTIVADLSTVGLDAPAYVFEARMQNGTVFTLKTGSQDPAGTIYYGLVNEFEPVVLISASSLNLLMSLFTNPPVILPEVTAEATVSVEMTAEATAEATEEATAEASEESE